MDNKTTDFQKVKYVVSSCLIGLNTRYDGGNKLCKPVLQLVKEGLAMPLCPEQAGGLTTPRPPAELVGGDGKEVLAGKARVITKQGKDVTHEFIAGALSMLSLARIIGAEKAILKSLSPSCGCGAIYDGTFSGNIVEGDGVTAALLKEAGLEVITEEELEND
ncbi:MAG: DUF523 domain-containing protein [Firmicutes bacterium]|nr:DUF523 domain-containing protein [Bacillota bacterium]